MPGTVFKAIAVKSGDFVFQLELTNWNQVKVYVNRQLFNLELSGSLQYDSMSLQVESDSRLFRIQVASQISFEVRLTPDMDAFLIQVDVPSLYDGKTRGLLTFVTIDSKR